MKRTLSVLSAIFVLTTASVTSSTAQVNVSVNIGGAPMWGPVCHEAVDYYYLPDIECYYYVPRHQFVYLSGPNWVFSYNLPARCRGYDLYSGYKVVCNEPRPYMNFYHDREVYARYRGCYHQQPVWRDCRGDRDRYYEGYEHPGRGHAWGHYKHGGDWDHGEGWEHGHGRGHGRWHDDD